MENIKICCNLLTFEFCVTYSVAYLKILSLSRPKPSLPKSASGPAAYANRPPDQLNVKRPRRKPASKGEAK